MPENSAILAATPSLRVAGDDQPLLADSLLHLVISEDIEGLYRCEATFNNWGAAGATQVDFRLFDRRTVDFGGAFAVAMNGDTIFDGRISAIEGHFLEHRAPELTVLSEDRFQNLRMNRRTRTFANLSDADICRQIAADNGLTADVNLDGPTHRVLAQTNQSDLAFVRQRARALDAELWMEGTTMHARSHQSRDSRTIRLTYGGDLRAFSVTADLARQCTAVAVNGWDTGAKRGIQFEATDSAIRGELGSDVSGVSILRDKFGERKQAIAHTVPLSSAEAQAESEAAFKRSARRFVVGHGIAQPTPRLRAGVFVDLQALGPLFSGKYYVTEAQHRFDRAAGFRTEFTAERPGIGSAS